MRTTAPAQGRSCSCRPAAPTPAGRTPPAVQVRVWGPGAARRRPRSQRAAGKEGQPGLARCDADGGRRRPNPGRARARAPRRSLPYTFRAGRHTRSSRGPEPTASHTPPSSQAVPDPTAMQDVIMSGAVAAAVGAAAWAQRGDPVPCDLCAGTGGASCFGCNATGTMDTPSPTVGWSGGRRFQVGSRPSGAAAPLTLCPSPSSPGGTHHTPPPGPTGATPSQSGRVPGVWRDGGRAVLALPWVGLQAAVSGVSGQEGAGRVPRVEGKCV